MLIVMLTGCVSSQHNVMKLGLFVVNFVVVLCFAIQVSGQSKQEDSIIYQTALSHTLTVYYDQLGDQSRLFNGSLYQGYDHVYREGNPYFLGSSGIQVRLRRVRQYVVY